MANKAMTPIQKQAFTAAAALLNKSSRFYADDLADLKSFYAKKSAADCRATIGRLSHRVTAREIRQNCQFEGLPR